MAALRRVLSRVASLVRKSTGLDDRENIHENQNCPQEGSKKITKLGENPFGSTNPHVKRDDTTEHKRICESDNCSETVPFGADNCPKCFFPFSFEVLIAFFHSIFSSFNAHAIIYVFSEKKYTPVYRQ